MGTQSSYHVSHLNIGRSAITGRSLSYLHPNLTGGHSCTSFDLMVKVAHADVAWKGCWSRLMPTVHLKECLSLTVADMANCTQDCSIVWSIDKEYCRQMLILAGKVINNSRRMACH